MKLSTCNVTTDEKGRELLAHGTALFPVACYDDDLAESPVLWHWHEEWEVLYVVEGNVTLSVGPAKHLLSAGEGAFINAGLLHAAEKAARPQSRIHSIVFHPRVVGGGLDSIYWQNYVQPLLDDPALRALVFDHAQPWHRQALAHVQQAWCAFAQEAPGFELTVRTELSALAFQLLQFHPVCAARPSEKALRDNERLKKMLLFVQQNYQNPLRVSMIAEAALLSESECMRCFRAAMNTSPIKYLKQYRLQKAAEQLRAGGQKIIDVALACGFQDVSYFIRAFKQAYGVTPSEFAKAHT